MALMSPIYVLFALHELYNLNLNYDLICQLNKGGGGIRDYILYIVDGARQTVTLEEGYHKDEARLQITGQLDS